MVFSKTIFPLFGVVILGSSAVLIDFEKLTGVVALLGSIFTALLYIGNKVWKLSQDRQNAIDRITEIEKRLDRLTPIFLALSKRIDDHVDNHEEG